MDMQLQDPMATPSGELRPRRASRRVRRRRVFLLLGVILVAALLVVGIIVVPPLVSRATAVARYEAVAQEITEVRDELSPPQGDAGVISFAAFSEVLAVDTPLVTEEASTAVSAALDEVASASGIDLALLLRPALEVETASIAELDAESAVLEQGLDDVRQGSAGAESLSGAAQQLQLAWQSFRDAVVAEGMRLLGDWSDAEKTSEDAFFQSLSAFQEGSSADAADALRAASTASEAMIADAQAYRDQLIQAATGVSTQPTGGDVDAQLDYLLTYWEDYNLAEWGDYNPYGGDCVNFTSQGLIARGWLMDDTWSSPGADGFASKAWISTTAMEAYLKSLGLTSNDNDHLDRVRVGDVGIFDWGERGAGVDHTMTVSKVEYTVDGPVVYFVSHNADGDYRELQYTLFEQHSDSTVRIYAIP